MDETEMQGRERSTTLVLMPDFDVLKFLRSPIPQINKRGYGVSGGGEVTRDGEVVAYLGTMRQETFRPGMDHSSDGERAIKIYDADRFLRANFFNAGVSALMSGSSIESEIWEDGETKRPVIREHQKNWF